MGSGTARSLGIVAVVVAALFVGAPTAFAAPANDNFANAQSIDALPQSVDGTTFGATAEFGEPAHGGDTASNSVWYRLTPLVSATVMIDLCGSSPKRVAIYTGSVLLFLSHLADNGPQKAC